MPTAFILEKEMTPERPIPESRMNHDTIATELLDFLTGKIFYWKI